MKRLSSLLIGLFFALGVFGLAVPVFAAPQDKVCEGIGLAGTSGTCEDEAGSPTVQGTVRTGVVLMSYLVGVAAIIMVILGAFKYVTSGGDTNKVTSAKNTIVYALIGLVVAVLAQILVRFVLTKASTVGTDPNACVKVNGRC